MNQRDFFTMGVAHGRIEVAVIAVTRLHEDLGREIQKQEVHPGVIKNLADRLAASAEELRKAAEAARNVFTPRTHAIIEPPHA